MLALVRAAAEHSHDEDRWIGCVIRTPSGILLSGTNRFADGVDHRRMERHAHPHKADWMAHAERKACSLAAREGIALAGATLWLDWYPCSVCGQIIIDCGIAEVVHLEPNFDHHRFGPSFRAAAQMFAEAGVRTREFRCELGQREVERLPRTSRAA
jgi:dCMP deaminase